MNAQRAMPVWVGLSLATLTAHAAALPAFPGAQGSGAQSVGGRGGTVYVVKSLADTGPGTLRECVEAAGPRTCVFAVSGVIELRSELYTDKPYLTVAGQTAPGGGIVLTPAPDSVLSSIVSLAAHDVVWQYTRLRNQFRAPCAESDSECGGLFAAHAGSYNIIADHNSLTWNQDEGYGVWRGAAHDVRDMTFSYSLIAEGLKTHSTGLIAGGSTSALSAEVTNIDMHHNLVMNNNHRNPLYKIRSGRIVNNLFYNQRFYVVQVGGGGTVDVIGNAFMKGPLYESARFHEIQAFASQDADAYDGEPRLYLNGNAGWNTGTQADMSSRVSGENGQETGPLPAQWQRTQALPAATYPIAVEPAERLGGSNGSVVATVGASRRLDCRGQWLANRDSVDTRLVNQVLTNTGISRLPADPADVGGITPPEAGPPCTDSDNDGMPDLWETSTFGSVQPGPSEDHDADGYTNLEEYLHGKERRARRARRVIR